MKLFKIVALLVLTTFFFNRPAYAGREGGGGDPCEDRIKEIASDISSWIAKGGSSPLALPPGISNQTYSTYMQSEISQAKVRCVAPGDQGYPVQINGVAKTCQFDRYNQMITCDLSKFQALTENQQYVLIHHEYAGLSNVEMPNGADSNYQVSNQIDAYLVDTVVKKLAVRRTSVAKVDFNSALASRNLNGAVQLFIELRQDQDPSLEGQFRVTKDEVKKDTHCSIGGSWIGPDGVYYHTSCKAHETTVSHVIEFETATQICQFGAIDYTGDLQSWMNGNPNTPMGDGILPGHKPLPETKWKVGSGDCVRK